MTAHPLARFSTYLAGRHALLVALADEIAAHLDAGERGRASDLMWLWTLGAYEVTRTLSAAPTCFATDVHRAVVALKADLERVRVPTTKLERVRYDRRAPPVPVDADRPPDAWDEARRDLRVGDPEDTFSARALLGRYRAVLDGITAADVLRHHRDA